MTHERHEQHDILFLIVTYKIQQNKNVAVTTQLQLTVLLQLNGANLPVGCNDNNEPPCDCALHLVKPQRLKSCVPVCLACSWSSSSRNHQTGTSRSFSTQWQQCPCRCSSNESFQILGFETSLLCNGTDNCSGNRSTAPGLHGLHSRGGLTLPMHNNRRNTNTSTTPSSTTTTVKAREQTTRKTITGKQAPNQ